MSDGAMSPNGEAPARFTSFSANAEDVLLHRIFGRQPTGFFVDVGAADPKMENDLKALYDQGWSGVNVEPNPALHAALVRERPRDRSYPVALADADGEQRYWEVEGTGLSTLDEAEAARCRARGWTVTERIVRTRTLAGLLAEVGATQVDVLKVDVEGWEERVLRGNDWSRWRPSVIVVEATLPERAERRDTGIRSFLAEQDYRLAWFDGLNDWFVRRDFTGADHAFEAPPNVFDRFDSYITGERRAQVASLEEHLALSKAHAAAERAARLEQDAAAARREREHGAEMEAARAVHERTLAAAAERASVVLHGLRDQENENERLRQSVCGLFKQCEEYSRQLEETHREREELLIHRRDASGLRERMAGLEGQVRELGAQLHVMAAACGRERAEAQQERVAREEAQNWMRAIRGSTSWRVTLPMRVAGRAVGRAVRRVRRGLRR